MGEFVVDSKTGSEVADPVTNIRLTDEEQEKINKPSIISRFERDKLERDAKKNWDLFYKRNGNRFFKRRYWTRHEFKELFSSRQNQDDQGNPKILLEIGCGCGDFVLPLLEENMDTSEQLESPRTFPTDLKIYCCDISDKAIDLLRNNPLYIRNNPDRIKAFTADVTQGSEIILDQMNGQQPDVVSLIFILSALDPDTMETAVANVSKIIKPEGVILIRDYAIYDKAMLRFDHRSKVSDQFYVRKDGTRAFFYRKEQLIEMFEKFQLICQSIKYVERETVNRASQDKFSRIFVQGIFKKPPTTGDMEQ